MSDEDLLPKHVRPLSLPQEPSIVVPVGVAIAALGTELLLLGAVGVGSDFGATKTDEVATLRVAGRYQFSFGSPKHSPKVTSL